MNFLLKIVEGPNKGAEIALVEGVAVTLGKADDCDIVLADPTLPDAPFTVAATASGVTLDGSALEPFHVKSAGSTAFAVGPADVAWGELVWEERGTGNGERGTGNRERGTGNREPGTEEAEGHEAADERREEEAPAAESEAAPKRRHGCLGCLLWLVLILLVLLGVAWFFRSELRPRVEQLLKKAGVAERQGAPRSGAAEAAPEAQEPSPDKDIKALAAKYGLSVTNDAGRTVLSGNFRTRAERLAATAEAYSSQLGVELDFSDDESFRTSASDALFTLTEGALKVNAATNRVLSIAGISPSSAALTKTLEALNADLPKLRNVDVKGVRLAVANDGETEDAETDDASPFPVSRPASGGRRAVKAKKHQPTFPVCGILTTPYPCLVMQDGRRILEGASVGESVVLKITADSVTITNANGRFTWKP